MLPFRSYLSKLGIRLDWIRLNKTFSKTYDISSPFSFRINVCVIKKIHVPFKNSLSSRRKEKKETFKGIYREQICFTHHKRNLVLFYFAQIDRILRTMHTRGKKHDTINWFSFHSDYYRSQATRASIERCPSKGIIVQTVSNRPRYNFYRRYGANGSTWTRLRKLTARKC